MFQKFSAESGVRLNRESDLRSSILAWAHAINWRERNIQVLVVLHLVILFLVVSTRKNIEIQASLLVMIGAIVLQTERLNTFLAKNWRQQGWSQNYFDEHGFFMLTAVSGPLLAVSILQVVLMLKYAADLLVVAGRAKARAQGREVQKGGKKSPVDYDDLPKKTE